MSNVGDVVEQVLSGQGLPNQQIDVWIRDGQLADIEQFAQKLRETWSDFPPTGWRFVSIYNHLIDKLTLHSEPAFVKTLLVVLRDLPPDETLARYVAARLVWAEALDAIDGIFKTLPYSPLWPYLIHELVIGDMFSLYEHLPQVIQAINEPHPLHVLPLKLLSSEEEIPTHRFGGSLILPDGNGRFGQVDPVSGIVLQEVTTPELQTSLGLPFEGWAQIEARQFKTQSSLSDDIITRTRLLLELNLECLEGVREESIQQVSSQHMMNTLFSAAINGGAYSRGVGNVYGRLAAWTSIKALMNEDVSTPIQTLNERMNEIEWFQLGASSPWFHQIAWDVGLIALSRYKHVLTVLAATDTD